MDTAAAIEALHLYVDPVVLHAKKEELATLLQEPVVGVIPSLANGSDGIKLSTIFFVTETFLAEVRQPSGPHLDFDVVSKKRVENYRVSTGKVQILLGDKTSEFEIAKITLVHGQFASEIHYAGDDSRSWLLNCIACLPFSCLQR